MKPGKPSSRRDFLRLTGAGTAVLLAGAADGRAFRLPATTVYAAPHAAAEAAANVVIDMEAGAVAVRPFGKGPDTQALGYHVTNVVSADPRWTVQAIEGSNLGPIIRVRKGDRLQVNLTNRMTEDTTMHWHGPHVPHDMDGHPTHAIGPGAVRTATFDVIDRASPLWFHPHPHMRTSEQVYAGLAGLLLVSDDEEETVAPGLSTGEHDVPLVLQDRVFDGDNQLVYQPNMMWGMLGDRILVNGFANYRLALKARAYRLRLYNGSNARTYKLAWSDGTRWQVIGTDGGLLSAPVERAYLTLMPGERLDVWCDFSALAGKQVTLRSLAFTPGGMGMGGMGGMGMGGGGMGMGGMMGGGALAHGAAFDIMTVAVGEKADSPRLGSLPAWPRYTPADIPNYNRPRTFTLAMQMGMNWTMNGRVFNAANMLEVAPDERVQLDSTEAWEWVNNSPIPHPMHMHNTQFQVMRRQGGLAGSYNTVAAGFVDTGWKDTVAVWPGERVRVAMRFAPYTGVYMYHCHILEHEDMTMMRNFEIV